MNNFVDDVLLLLATYYLNPNEPDFYIENCCKLNIKCVRSFRKWKIDNKIQHKGRAKWI